MAILEWLKELDELLRGRRTTLELLAEGTDHLPIKPYVLASLVLGALYGVFMGLYAVMTRTPPCFLQTFTTAIKVPALFLFTLVVTFPSLYVFSALLGVSLGLVETLRLLIAAIAINLAVLASFGPITGFFTLTTTSYHFMKLLNVIFFATAGAIGLGFLMTILRRLEAAQMSLGEPLLGQGSDPEQSKEEPDPGAQTEGVSPPPPGAPPAPGLPGGLPLSQLRRPESRAQVIFKVWLVLYALVGAQMGWVLRPFIGAPDLPFVLFRGRDANIFIDVIRTLGKLLGA